MLTIRQGDCRQILTEMPAQSVHCCVTSPPYFGLRDYGVAGQIGLEPTPDAYVAELVAVFRDLRRVLRDDGTLWLNLGDSYAGSSMTGGNSSYNSSGGTEGYKQQRQFNRPGNPDKNGGISNRDGNGTVAGMKPKDLIGIPWRVAFALQADGWYLRQDIIWSKPNPMPESVTDRCTKAHEYIFLMSKSARYYYDAVAIEENAQTAPGATWADRKAAGAIAGNLGVSETYQRGVHGNGSAGSNLTRQDGKRNKRSVWEVATQPYSEAHFATFPPGLIEPCIKAGTSERGCCGQCGAPRMRQTERRFIPQQDVSEAKGVRGAFDQKPMDDSNSWQGFPRGSTLHDTIGWQPSCTCDAAAVPCTILDPFGSAGTTGLVADRLGRSALLIELNPAYADMAKQRMVKDAGMFADIQNFPIPG